MICVIGRSSFRSAPTAACDLVFNDARSSRQCATFFFALENRPAAPISFLTTTHHASAYPKWWHSATEQRPRKELHGGFSNSRWRLSGPPCDIVIFRRLPSASFNTTIGTDHGHAHTISPGYLPSMTLKEAGCSAGVPIVPTIGLALRNFRRYSRALP